MQLSLCSCVSSLNFIFVFYCNLFLQCCLVHRLSVVKYTHYIYFIAFVFHVLFFFYFLLFSDYWHWHFVLILTLAYKHFYSSVVIVYLIYFIGHFAYRLFILLFFSLSSLLSIYLSAYCFFLLLLLSSLLALRHIFWFYLIFNCYYYNIFIEYTFYFKVLSLLLICFLVFTFNHRWRLNLIVFCCFITTTLSWV